MKCILLAAGYATRLYPLTKDRPKSLLPIGNSTILEFIIRKIEQVDDVEQIYIVTNERFVEQFQKWAAQYSSIKKITVLNDGTTTNENRLGAIADLAMVLEHEKIDEDILVLAGDNLFDFALEDFVKFFNNVGHDCITAHELTDCKVLQRTGVVEIDNRQCIISFEEKPQQPKSNLAVPPFYIYQRATLPLIKQYLKAGNNPDAPGNFIPWLLTQKDVYAYRFNGNRYDIGTLESYEEVCKLFS
jgi:glucose-1-phosphate thymidylyltransferase